MSTEVESYRNMPMAGKWEYAGRLSAAEDLLPASFYGQVRNPNTGAMERKILPGKVFLVIEYGAMLGVPPVAAINGIHVIEGKPSMSAAMMSGLVRRAGHKLRIRQSGTVAGGDYSATAILIRGDDPDEEIVATWTPQRAVIAELLTSYEPDTKGRYRAVSRSQRGNALNWEKYTENMCKWRAISEVCRLGADDVFMGAAYTPDELGEIQTVEDVEATGALIAALDAAPNASAAQRLFKSWQNEGIDIPQTVAAHAMQRVARLTAEEATRAAHAPAGEEEAVEVPADAPTPADAADGQQEETVDAEIEPDEEDPLIADARKVMAPAEFDAWLAARPGRSNA